MRVILRLVALLLCAWMWGAAQEASAGQTLVAVAANFAPVMEPLARRFEESSGHRVEVSFGSSGSLYAQIRHGAPFEVLLSADAERPRRLEEDGDAVAGTRFTYAVGRLALWGPRLAGPITGAATMADANLLYLAIADPDAAPYGRAAREALVGLNLWNRLPARLVRGESIAQAHQFVASGAAEVGLVALSQVVGEAPSSWWIVPARLHAALEQQAVLLEKGRGREVAEEFLRFLAGEGARRIIADFGYDLPKR